MLKFQGVHAFNAICGIKKKTFSKKGLTKGNGFDKII